MELQEFKSCTKQHGPRASVYPRDKVPAKLFLKDENDPNSGEYKTCSDCREFRNKGRVKKKLEYKDKKDYSDPNFKSCSGDHPSSGSPYPKNKVPIHLFFKEENNPDSGEYKTCSYCREYRKNIHKRSEKRKKERKDKEDDSSEYRECSCNGHKSSNSPYNKLKVPAKLFLKDPENPESKIYKNCFHCRKYRTIPLEEHDEDSEFKSCLIGHSEIYSPYPINKVPKNLFLEDPEDPESKEYKTCFHCRKIQNDEYRKNYEEKINILRKKNEVSINNGEKFIHCLSGYHEASGSKFPKDKIPLENFKKYSDYDEEYYISCIDCREYKREVDRKRFMEKKKEVEEKGLSFCIDCEKGFPLEKMGVNKNGKVSCFCIECKIKRDEKFENKKKEYKELKLKYIRESQCSCLRCKKIFLKPKGGELEIEKINTYEKNDDNRYIFYKNIEYNVNEFLNEYEYLIEYSVIQFDHLTEEEQRERELIKEDESFIPKYKEIPKIRSKFLREKELKKCQHLCIKCHIKETIKREKGCIDKSGKTQREKKEYVNKIKENGCSSCGYQNNNILRFFDMDHIDPSDKIEAISHIVYNKNSFWSFEDLVEECKKCRVLCKFCHAVNTRLQHENNVFYSNY